MHPKTTELLNMERRSLAHYEAKLADKLSIFGTTENYRRLMPAESGELLTSIAETRELLASIEADTAKWDARHQREEEAMARGDVLGSLVYVD
jgi:hypothetical protein